MTIVVEKPEMGEGLQHLIRDILSAAFDIQRSRDSVFAALANVRKEKLTDAAEELRRTTAKMLNELAQETTSLGRQCLYIEAADKYAKYRGPGSECCPETVYIDAQKHYVCGPNSGNWMSNVNAVCIAARVNTRIGWVEFAI